MLLRLLLIAAVVFTPVGLYADSMQPLLGTSVTGYLFFPSDPTTNYFNVCREQTPIQCGGPVTPGDASGYTYVLDGSTGNRNFFYHASGAAYGYLAEVFLDGRVIIAGLCFSDPCSTGPYTIRLSDIAYTAPLVSSTNTLGLSETFSGNTLTFSSAGGTFAGPAPESIYVPAALTPTPEPDSLMLLASGMVCVGLTVRKRIWRSM